LAEKGFLLEINHPLLPENTLVCEGVDKEGHGIPLKPGNYSLKQIKSVLENSGLRCMQRGRSLIITQKPPEKSRSLDLPFEAKIHFDVEGNEIVELGDPLRGSDLEFWAKNRAFARQLKETSLRTFIYYCKEDYKLEIDPGELRNRLGDILMVDSYTERTILNLLNEAFRKAGLNYHAGVREKESKISILPGPVPTEAPEKKSEGKSSVSTPKQPEKSVPPRRTTTPAKTR